MYFKFKEKSIMEPRTYELAKKIYIEHLICGYPTPPPDWVYEMLNRGS